MAPSPPSPLQNHILKALPKAVRERLFPHLKLVALRGGEFSMNPALRFDRSISRSTA